MSFNLEERLILRTSPGTLSRIASFKLALYCWQQHLKIYCSSSLFVEIQKTIKVSDIFRVSLPKRIMELINGHIELLKLKLYSWSKFHSRNVFETSHDNVFFNCLDCVVLKPSGSIICFESTAKNLMASDRLSMIQKYSIACTYCFTEHIKWLWPLIPNHFQPLSLAMIYWNNKNRYIDVGLPQIERVYYQGWYLPAKLKYCSIAEANIPENSILDTIDVRDEISLDTVLFLLSNLDTTRQNELLRKFSITLLRVLALQDEEPSIRTLQLWHHAKGYINNDQFYDLMILLCRTVFCIFRTVGPYVDVLLNEMWIAASNHQRTKVANRFSFPYFIMNPLPIESIDMRNYSKGVGFYLNLLGCRSFKERNELWRKFWVHFIYLARVSELNSLMSLCLRDADEVAEFIKNYMVCYSVLKRQLIKFALTGKYQELTEYLTCFYPNAKSVQETQQKILNSMLEYEVADEYSGNFIGSHVCRFNLYSDQCIAFNDLVDNAFPTKDSAQQFKKDFILHYAMVHKKKLSSSFMLEEIRDMAEAFFSCDQGYLIEMKLKIYELCRPFAVIIEPRTALHIRTRTMREWREFFKWCGFEEVPVLKIGTCETYVVVCSSWKSWDISEFSKNQRI